MVTDGAALGLAALSAWLAARPPSVHHSYGWGRAELLSALINALAMFAIVAVIAYEAWQRFNAPLAIEGGTVTVVAVAGLAINLIVARIQSQGHDNVNMRAAFIHVLGDILGSIAALVAGLVIWFTGWTPSDPLENFSGNSILALFITGKWLIAEGVASSPNGPNQVAPGSVIDRLAKPPHIDVHRPVAIDFTAPDAIENLLAGKHASRV
jgi:cation diffusion facilitator family transporter